MANMKAILLTVLVGALVYGIVQDQANDAYATQQKNCTDHDNTTICNASDGRLVKLWPTIILLVIVLAVFAELKFT